MSIRVDLFVIIPKFTKIQSVFILSIKTTFSQNYNYSKSLFQRLQNIKAFSRYKKYEREEDHFLTLLLLFSVRIRSHVFHLSSGESVFLMTAEQRDTEPFSLILP